MNVYQDNKLGGEKKRERSASWNVMGEWEIKKLDYLLSKKNQFI